MYFFVLVLQKKKEIFTDNGSCYIVSQRLWHNYYFQKVSGSGGVWQAPHAMKIPGELVV